MSHGPPRAYSSQSYSALPRQQVMNNQQPFQQNLINNSTTLNSSSNGGGSTTTAANSTQETLYCDSCQTFRHVSFFNEKDFKYNVCNLCHAREMQKRKHQLERYEMYEEQQRTLKQARYQNAIQYPVSSSPQGNNNNNSPITLNDSRSSNTNNTPPSQTLASPQIKTSSSPIMLNQTTSPHNSKNVFTPTTPNTSMRNQSQLQSHMHSLQPSITLPSLPPQLQQQSPPSPQDLHDKSSNSNNSNLTPIMLPNNPIFDSPTPTSSNSSSGAEKDTIDLDQFVKELEKETEFDRKQYHLDIELLMNTLGENAGFTQLGRGICEKVLEGTSFNFSLKDRRRSTKSPDTLSTLRYYCSQRSDTAKPRKADNPKAQNRYDCAGALTIIIDLVKKTANVTVIHKHQHPPFVSQHYHQQQQKKAQQQQANQQTLALQQQLRQRHVERQYEILRQKVADIGTLLEGQQRLGNAEFLQTALEALSSADEMLQACKAHEAADLPPNKFTMHYNKTGDYV